MPHYQAWEEFTRAAEKLYLADPMKVGGGRGPGREVGPRWAGGAAGRGGPGRDRLRVRRRGGQLGGVSAPAFCSLPARAGRWSPEPRRALGRVAKPGGAASRGGCASAGQCSCGGVWQGLQLSAPAGSSAPRGGPGRAPLPVTAWKSFSRCSSARGRREAAARKGVTHWCRT